MADMDAAELTRVLEVVASLWPNADTERRTAAGYRLLLGDLPYAEVLAALRHLAMDGREFPPPPGLVAATVERRSRQAILASMEAGTLDVAPPAPALTRPRRDLE